MDFNTALKVKLNEVFQFTIDFLNSHNLRWFVGYGTAIGAVRHHGIIPWDDDIDIIMPREDYDRLLSIRDELKATKYSIICMGDDKYWLPFAKFIDTTTTIWEYANIPCIIGVYVDVFPLDPSSLDFEEYNTAHKMLYYLYKAYEVKQTEFELKPYISKLLHTHFGTVIHDIKIDSQRLRSLKSITKKILVLNQKVYDPKGEKMICSVVPLRIKGYFERSWFDSYVEMQFESYFVKVPSGYDEYLTMVYGDYMTPPPVNKRVLTHEGERYYCNLEEGLTLAQVKQRIMKGEKLVY